MALLMKYEYLFRADLVTGVLSFCVCMCVDYFTQKLADGLSLHLFSLQKMCFSKEVGEI